MTTSDFIRKDAEFMHCGSRKLKLVVEGEPVAQERARFHGHAYEPAKSKNAKANIRAIADAEMYAQGFTKAHKDMPVALTCWFYRPVPVSKALWLRTGMRHNIIAPTPKWKDVDNCIKLVSDALNGLAYEDDAQVVEVHGYSKYAEEAKTEILVEAFYVNNGDVREEALRLRQKDKENS